MEVFKIGEEFIILKGTKDAEPKFREALSKLIVEKYEKGPYDERKVTDILSFCQSYYISEFEKNL